MPSNEKKEIVQNTIFGVIGGLLMGGPAGAIVAGLTGAGLAALEEKKDEELRRKQYERLHPDPVKVYEEKKKREIESQKRSESFGRILHTFHDDPTSLHNIHNYTNMESDPYKNNSSIVRPNVYPYVIVNFYKPMQGIGDTPYQTGHGKVYETFEFEEQLMKDVSNPRFEKFRFSRGCHVNSPLNHYVYYMYTVDGGENYHILWQERRLVQDMIKGKTVK